ncbi:MAG: FecR domain-containing protein [Verrucomicrobiota bacterium]
MNSSPSRHDPAVDEQAAYWAARLDGGDVLESSERTALDAWLAQSPAHRAALSDYCQFSADLEEQLPALVETGAVQMPAAPRPARRWFSLPVFSGLALAAAAAVAVVVYVQRPAGSAIENITSIAQRSTHTLSDGTRVELNAHTRIVFENKGNERLVRLLNGGEALFAVAKDRSRPFIVETQPNGRVRVTGTTFNVRNDPASTTTSLEVTVVEGSVLVNPTDADKPYSLGAGDQLSAGPGGVVKVQPLAASALAEALAWREGNVVFNDVPLRDAAARFARYHGRQIVVDPAVATRGVGGVHALDDLNAFLDALEVMLPVKATRDDLNGAVSIAPRAGS